VKTQTVDEWPADVRRKAEALLRSDERFKVLPQRHLAMPPEKYMAYLLKNQKVPRSTVAVYSCAHSLYRRDLRSVHMRKNKRVLFWRRLINPLKYEVHNIEAGVQYLHKHKPHDTERLQAYTAYLAVLRRIEGLLVLAREQKEYTPREFADAWNDDPERSKQYRIPNNGEHWTDWVGPKARARIQQTFARLPWVKYTKPRTPFPRTLPPTMWRIERQRMEDMLKEKIKATADTKPEEYRKALVALAALRDLKPNAYIPYVTGWPRLLGDEEDE
jgi:hypothetical protein